MDDENCVLNKALSDSEGELKLSEATTHLGHKLKSNEVNGLVYHYCIISRHTPMSRIFVKRIEEIEKG